MIISPWILLRMRNISDRICRANRPHILCSRTFFRKSFHLWDIVEKSCRAKHATDDITVRRMRLACWITKATHTHTHTHTPTICNTYCFSTIMVTRTRIGVLLCAHCPFVCNWDSVCWRGSTNWIFFNVITSPVFLKKDAGCSDRRQPYIHHCLPCLSECTFILADVYFRD